MKLLEPIKVGKTTFKNRIMFPPLTTGYEEKDGSIGEQSLAFYTRLAKGGVGYIVIGDVVPIPTFSPTPKLFSDHQIPTFKRLADSLHQYGAKLGLQIFHPEYDAEALFTLFREGKVDEMRQKLHHDMLHYVNEVSEEQLNAILEKIKLCVKRALEAGVDAIEVHGDRLVGSLCSTIINKRTDGYGGSFENRTKFALQVVDAIRAVSSDIVIDYKLPIVTKMEDGSYLGKGGLILEEAIELSKILEKHGVDTIHVAQANHTGNMNDTIPAMGTRSYGFMLEETRAIKNVVSIPVSTVGRICSPLVGETLLENGTCDIVAYGRSLLADPDIAVKLEKGEINEIRECIMCNKGCTDAIQNRKFLSCVLNAENGYENTRKITPAQNPRKVAVIGAGVAGLEAARVLALKGHEVDVYEKSLKVGGQINIAAVPPRKEEMFRILNYYQEVLKGKKVNIFLNREFKKEDASNYEDIIVAIGAHNLVPNIKGIDGKNVVNSWDVLANKEVVFGKVAVCGGGLVGAETAEYLANKGNKVTIIEMLDAVAKEESSTILPTMMNDFKKHNVEIKILSKIKEIKVDGVLVDILDKEGNVLNEEFIKADFVVNALASAKNKLDFEIENKNVIYVGDCFGERPSTIDNAIKTAYDAANSIN